MNVMEHEKALLILVLNNVTINLEALSSLMEDWIFNDKKGDLIRIEGNMCDD